MGLFMFKSGQIEAAPYLGPTQFLLLVLLEPGFKMKMQAE